MTIYFSGIGGVGLGPLAEIARDAGYTVTGSDLTDSLTIQELRSTGIIVEIGQNGSFLQTCHDTSPVDWFIYTAALPADHPELQLAKKLGIRTAKRDELLAHIIKQKNLQLIAVSGTHGKTTTTAMLVWALQQLGVAVSYAIGSQISFGPSGAYNPDSHYFIYECDEFDRNFLHFHPTLSLVTSLDYDHPDTYPTEADYTAAFRTFVDQSGSTIMWQNDGAHIDATADDGWILNSTDIMPVKIAGEHNRRNATLVCKAVEKLGITGDSIAVLNDFPGSIRRFEKLAGNLYSDYGHHPVEIAATLQMAREVNDHIVLVYQPHQNVRQHEIQDQYTDQFELAEEIYWLPTYLSREGPTLELLTPDYLIRNVTNKQNIHISDLDDALWNSIQAHRQDGALVLCMGAGSIDSWVRERLLV
ncbi:hypothetical protein EON76_00925 [bacterium]|nr:MAG: hypothetical protein EON76_00925 [bacterium]